MRGPTQLLMPPEFHVDALSAAQGIITITAHTTSLTAEGPTGQPSSRQLPSHSVRLRADVPWGSSPVRWQVTVRRCRCRTPACEQHLVAERLHAVAAVAARRTLRLSAAREYLAFALGGEAGARFARELGLCPSPDTLLRVLRHAADPIDCPVTVGGVDDWAWRNGHRSGTLLVDRARHRAVDRLPDRSAAGCAAGLPRHAGMRVISRDRGAAYAVGRGRDAGCA